MLHSCTHSIVSKCGFCFYNSALILFNILYNTCKYFKNSLEYLHDDKQFFLHMHAHNTDVLSQCRLMQVPKPWYRSYVTAKAAMQQDLFGTNPTMAAVLDLWHKTFG